jgi:hypothetical protein
MNKKSHASLRATLIMLGVLILLFTTIIWVNIKLDTQFGQDLMKEFTPFVMKLRYFFIGLFSKITSR